MSLRALAFGPPTAPPGEALPPRGCALYLNSMGLWVAPATLHQSLRRTIPEPNAYPPAVRASAQTMLGPDGRSSTADPASPRA